MDLFFETQTGSTFSIEVGYWDTVLEIKKKIEKYQGVLVSQQTLIFKGKYCLLDIEKCNIFHNSLLYVIVSNANHSSDQVLQIKQSPVSPNSVIGDIIFGQDLPMTTEHFMNIQAFYPDTTEEIEQVTVGSTKNNNQVLKTPPLKSAEQIINDQDLPVAVQVKSLLSNTVKEIVNVQESHVKGRSNEKDPKRINNDNDQVVQTEERPPPVKEMVSIDWKPVEVKMIPMKMTVLVLPYSSARSKIRVDVNPRANVETLRKELVKSQLNLPQEGYFFKHRHNKMVEDETFWWNGVDSFDTIEISPIQSI